MQDIIYMKQHIFIYDEIAQKVHAIGYSDVNWQGVSYHYNPFTL